MKKLVHTMIGVLAALLVAACATPGAAFDAPQPPEDSPLFGIEPAMFSFEEPVEGALTEDDSTSEEYFTDAWAFEAPAGVSVAVYVTSAEFDTYLFAVDAAGTEYSNDDSYEYQLPNGLDSAITLSVYEEPTPVTVYVSSYAVGEVGAYTLSAVPADSLEVLDSEPVEPPPLEGGEWRSLEELGLPAADMSVSMGDSVIETLTADDFESFGYYLDGYSLSVSSGDFVRVDVIGGEASDGFTMDTRLIVLTPAGEFLSNDDAPMEADLPNGLDSSVTFTA